MIETLPGKVRPDRRMQKKCSRSTASTQVVADKDVMWKGFVSFAQSHLHVIARFCISRSAKTGNCSTSAESAVASLAEDVDDGFEGEPLRDLLVGSQSSSELGAGQLHDLLALGLGDALLNVAVMFIWHLSSSGRVVGDIYIHRQELQKGNLQPPSVICAGAMAKNAGVEGCAC
eukprot:CAMPEP_0194783658 /NCGR_PEP_ID=MMETSP0323_2-20130528/79345_1 /TAXON_ID=2866 ORGANISM="Crypthecodinium cohnii, Strain Seligo" /NCGR_SAMPLE_ID=MMETSP0323_2 /ASSEMBLY_ACC=CAM_ASM_000346 /LENGTH=173 /DNA_ID=CAMNT_0039722565 /DNA_START=269 /DNA_END=790 /DNA_ORIENTATION=+